MEIFINNYAGYAALKAKGKKSWHFLSVSQFLSETKPVCECSIHNDHSSAQATNYNNKNRVNFTQSDFTVRERLKITGNVFLCDTWVHMYACM